MNAAEIAQALGGERRIGGKRYCRCPLASEHNNNDQNPSLVAEDKDGGVYVHCFSRHADDQARVIQALKDRGLWPAPGRNGNSGQKKRIVATYPYWDEAGQLLYQVVRWAPKAFSQRRPDGRGDWIANLNGVNPVLYHLPELRAKPGETVYVVEGEKDADALYKLGFLSTTNSGGAGKWTEDYSTMLSARDVVILPDADEIGRSHAEHVARSLQPVAKSIKIVELPGLPTKGDVSDWLAQCHTPDELCALVAKAAPYASASNSAGGLLCTVKEYLAKRKERRGRKQLWAGILREGEVSILVGRALAGKSTFACTLARSLLLGTPLLGRECLKMRVAYLALERNGGKVADLFANWNLEDMVFAADLPADNGQALAGRLEADIERTKVEVMIIDHLQNLVRLQDANDYAKVSLALEPFVRLAKKTGCHLMFLHHQGKTRREDGIDVMGSEAFRANADAILEATKSADSYYLRAHVRDSDNLQLMRISVNLANGEVTGLDAKQAEFQDAARKICDYLREQGSVRTEGEIREGVRLGKNLVNAVLRSEIEGVIRTGTGKKGDPFLYSYGVTDDEFVPASDRNGLFAPVQMVEGVL